MRKPGGIGILELQEQERLGRFNDLAGQQELQNQKRGVQRDKGHLGMQMNVNPMQNLGELNYPKYQYDDRFTDLELTKFNDMFVYFDKGGNGTMDVRDLPKAMRAMGALITDREVQQLIHKYDQEKTGFISFTDFQ